MSFIFRGSARFNWHSCAVASLKVPAMIVYDMVMNVLDTKWFPQHSIAGLISGITFIVLFQSEEASTVEGNKHTETKCIGSFVNNHWKNFTHKKFIIHKVVPGVCVCVCLFPFTEQNNKGDARDQARDVVLRKYSCVKNLSCHVTDNYSRDVQVSNCAKECQLNQAEQREVKSIS